MEGLWIAVATCVLVSCSVKGNYLQQEYEEAGHPHIMEALSESVSMNPKKTQTARKRHPLFQCPDMSPSPSVPTSVEFVKPADIKVIAALGDSLTTAFGANASTMLELPVEFRHVSWSIGGHRTCQDVITLPNIFKLFNPNLIGASSGKTTFMKKAHVMDASFNLAVTGDTTSSLPRQTRRLIDKLRHDEDLNFDEDWKLLTILIGMNDICDYCKDKDFYSAEEYIYYIKVSLEMLMNEVPRMIVNVVQILPMKALREVKRFTPACLLHRATCSCVRNPGSKSQELQELVEVNLEYQKKLEDLLSGDRFFGEDFAVVLQPFLKHADLPRLPNGKVDMTYFAYDCFHLSLKGHEELAKGLWNNMVNKTCTVNFKRRHKSLQFQPVGEKTMVKSFSDPIKLICPPAEHPYIYTRPQIKRLEKHLE